MFAGLPEWRPSAVAPYKSKRGATQLLVLALPVTRREGLGDRLLKHIE